MKTHIIIIGHGLAGAILSLFLHERGVPYTIIEDGVKPSSSRVAAGLFNPVTGRVMKPTWRALELFPFMLDFYRKWQLKCPDKFLFELPIIRPFTDNIEANMWTEKADHPSVSGLIGKIHKANNFLDLKAPYGSMELTMSGYLDTRVFLDFVYLFNQQKGCIKNSLSPEEDSKNLIIHCEGSFIKESDNFNWLPFRPVKGEILTVETPHEMNLIYNRGVFVIPLKNNLLRIGATYNWKEPDWEASKEGKKELLEKWKKLMQVDDFTVVSHDAGVRPATKDRRPVIGKHPVKTNRYVFGGWGSKGVSLIPFFANQFVDHLTVNKEIEREVSIERFYSLY